MVGSVCENDRGPSGSLARGRAKPPGVDPTPGTNLPLHGRLDPPLSVGGPTLVG